MTTMSMQMDRIVTVVAAQYNLERWNLLRRNNEHSVVRVRQVAMWLMRELTMASLPQIGRVFSGNGRRGKHHTTVMYSIRECVERMKDDPVVHSEVLRLQELLEAEFTEKREAAGVAFAAHEVVDPLRRLVEVRV